MAPTSIRNVLLEVVGNSTDAQRALDELVASLRAAPDHKDIEVRAKTQEAQREIRAFLAELKKVDRSKVEPEIRVALTKAIVELEGFDALLDDVDGRRVAAHAQVEVDRASIQRALEEATALLEATQASHKAIIVDLDLKITDAERNIARVRAELDAIPAERTVELQARADQLERVLAGAEAKLDGLQARRDVQVIRFDAQTAKAEANVARLHAELVALPDRETIDVRVNESITRDLDGVNKGLASLTGGLGRVTEAGQRFGDEFSNATVRVSTGFLSFGGVLGPIFGILIALAVTIGVSLVAALAALVASLAAAAAGAVALGAAVAGALGPALGLAVAVAGRLAKIVEALKAQDAAAQQVGAGTAAGSAEASAAMQREEDAARTLGRAQEALGRARAAALREMEDAAVAAKKAILGVEDAEISLDRSRLSVEEAAAALRDYSNALDETGRLSRDFQKFTDVSVDFDASAINQAVVGAGGTERDALKMKDLILDLREARQREKEAVVGVADAERNRARALEVHNAFVRDGIKASAGYAAALQGVEDAQRAANQAQEAPGPIAAQQKAAFLIGELSKRERQFLAAIVAVRKELRGGFRAATDAVFGGMIRALLRVPRLVNPLRGAFAGLGRDVAAALDIFSGELIRPEWISAIRRFIAAGGRIARTFTSGILIGFLRIVRDIATVALPHLERMLLDAGRALRGFSAQNGPREMRDVVGALVEHLRSWLSLSGQLARVFINFVRAGAGEGRNLVEELTEGARKLADFLASTRGRNQVAEFFRRVIPQAKEFLKNVAQLTVVMLRFVNDTSPGVTKLLALLSRIIEVLQRVGAFKGALFALKDIVTSGSVSAVEQARRAVDRLRTSEEALKRAQERGERAVRDLTRARRDARRELADSASFAAGAKQDKARAGFDLRQARAELRALKARGGSADELEGARLDVTDAELRYADAVRDSARAQQDNADKQKAGVKGTETYRSAIDALKTTMKDTTTALRDYVNAQRAASNPPPPNLSLWDRLKAAAGSAASFVGGAFTSAWAELKTQAGTALDVAKTTILGRLAQIAVAIVTSGPRLFAAAVEWVGNFARGAASRERAAETRAAIGRLIQGGIDHVRDFFAGALEVGRSLGEKIADGIGLGLRNVVNLGRGIINGLIDVFNAGIRTINQALPDKVNLRGLPDVNLPNNPIPGRIPHLRFGGLTTGPTAAVIGDNPGGREAVLPLSRRVLRQLATAIMGSLGDFTMAPAYAGSGRGALATAGGAGAGGPQRPVFNGATFKIEAPAGAYPDARTTMTHFERLVDRVGGDPNAG